MTTSLVLVTALVVQSTENLAELIDGSEHHPLRLPNLQKVIASGIAEILVRLPDGTIGALNFGQYTGGRKKLSIIDGVLTPEDDYLSDLFSGEICEADCSDIESALGVKQIVDTCVGEPDTIRYQLCRIPTCCCEGETAAETCIDTPLLTEVLAAGEITPTA
jgi:hypothetical protein